MNDNNNNIENRILYIWNKEWVRPKESVYSIIRNFCNVNALSGTKAMNLLGYHNSFHGKYRDLLQTLDMFIRNSHTDLIEQDLLPDWYLEENKILEKNFYHQYSKIFNNEIRYCPICERENYHSYVHQMEGLNYCPFHKRTKLIHINRKYGIHDIKLCEKNFMDEDMILPFQRHIKPDFYNSIQIDNLFLQHVCVTPYLENYYDIKYEYYFDFISQKQPEKKWTVKLWDTKNIEIIQEAITNWVKEKKLPIDCFDPSYNSCVQVSKNYASFFGKNSLIDNFIYKKMCYMLNSIDDLSFIWRNRVDKYNPLRDSDRKLLPIFYCWFTLKTEGLLECFHHKWVLTSIKCFRFLNTETSNPTPYIITLVGNGEAKIKHLVDWQESKIINPLIVIVDDYFDSLYEEINSKFAYYGRFTVFELSERLPVPEYYVFINAENELEIWKYIRKPMKTDVMSH